jgi:hypothetical protein
MPKTDTTPLEPEVDATVYDAAMARARSQGQRLATVARLVLFQEAAKTPVNAPAPEKAPPRREYRRDQTAPRRKTIKFKVATEPYRQAREQIAASGRSVAAAIEDGLRHYARTGALEPLAPQEIR